MFVLLLTLAGCEPTEKRTGNTGDVKDVTGQKDPVTTVVKDPNPLTKEFVVYRVQKNGEEILIPEKAQMAVDTTERAILLHSVTNNIFAKINIIFHFSIIYLYFCN